MIIKAKTLIFTGKKYKIIQMPFAHILGDISSEWFLSGLPWLLEEKATLKRLKHFNSDLDFSGIKLIDIEIHVNEI
jgi:hypothetical protein